MRLNSKIVSVIISLAFVGGMFSAVYAGPVIATITLDGNVHTTGDSTVDGDLSVGGVSFAALDARVAALETSTVPMVIANEAMITNHDAMILSNEANIAINAAAIAAGGGEPNQCNPNGDSEITAQEIFDLLVSEGIPLSLATVQNQINSAEIASATNQFNGVIDSLLEVTQFNSDFMVPYSGITCTYP